MQLLRVRFEPFPIDPHIESLVSNAAMVRGGILGKALDRRALTSLMDRLVY